MQRENENQLVVEMIDISLSGLTNKEKKERKRILEKNLTSDDRQRISTLVYIEINKIRREQKERDSATSKTSQNLSSTY